MRPYNRIHLEVNMIYDPNFHHRRSIRLKGYDYTHPGAYFVTIVSDQRKEIFGQVINDEMSLSPLGEILRVEWMRSSDFRKEIHLHEDEFVIMPNHIHGIVWIVAVGADGIRPIEEGGTTNTIPNKPSRTLGRFVAGFKASVTSRTRRELNITNIWQRNYYDHIIRNDDELRKIWDYIDSNPRKWFKDRYHSSASG